MKNKITLLLLLLMVAVSIVGCKSEKTDDKTTRNPSVEESKTDEKKQEDEKTDEVVSEQAEEPEIETIKTEPSVAPEGHTHSYEIEIIKATCTTSGYTLHTCECGDKYQSDTIEKTGHSFGAWETVKAATALKKGSAERKCSSCGCVETKELDKLSLSHKHSYDKKVVKPTCKSEGYTVHTCECGDSYTSDKIAKSEHKYESRVVSPTCIAEGYTVYTCKCGDNYVGSKTNKTSHVYQETSRVEPKCQQDGYVQYSCKQCSDSYKTVLQKSGHSYKQTNRIEATTTSDGYIEYTCENCKGTTKETLPRIDVDKTYTIDLGNGQTTTVVGHFDTQMANEIYNLLNAYRNEQGIQKLTNASAALQEAANIRAYEIVYKFEHIRPNGERALESFNSTTDCCAENLARYQSGAEHVMESWKNSPSHNKSMLKTDANSVAIGVFAEKRTSGTRVYYYYHFVQLFAW